MSDFKKSFQDFLDNVEQSVIQEQKEVMFTLLRNFILVTPQDESVAVAHWTNTVDHKDAPITGKSDPNGSKAIIDGVTEIEKFKKLGVITLTNPMPYIMRIIEEGHSKQTPPGTASAIIAQLETSFFSK